MLLSENKSNGIRGFSLIEILLVLVILSMSAVMLSLNYEKKKDKLQVENAALELANFIDEARNNSIKYTGGKAYIVNFEVGSDTAVLYSCNGEDFSNCWAQKDTPEIRNLSLKPPVEFKLPVSKIMFEPLSGRAAGPTGNQLKTSSTHVVVQGNSWRSTITIPPTGPISVTTEEND